MGGFGLTAAALRHLAEMLAGDAMQGVLVSILGLVFVISGAQKVRNPLLASFAFVDFRATSRPNLALGLALGGGELTLGAWLLLRLATPWALAVACTLLCFFTYLLIREIQSGQRHPCHCFGAKEDQLSWRTVARTASLATLSAVGAAFAPSQAPFITVAVLQLIVASAFVGLFTLSVARKELAALARHQHSGEAA